MRIASIDPTDVDSEGDGSNDSVDPHPLIVVPQARGVVFRVDMSVQTAKGNFDAVIPTPGNGNVVLTWP